MTNSEMKAAAQSNLDLIMEQIEIYSVAKRVSDTSWVVIANENPGETACLTRQEGGHNFQGGPVQAVRFDNRQNAEVAAESAAKLFDSEHIRPVVVGLGTAFRRKLAALVEMRHVMEKTIAAIGE